MIIDAKTHNKTELSERGFGFLEVIFVFILAGSFFGLASAILDIFIPEFVICMAALVSILYWNFLRLQLPVGTRLLDGLNWYHVLIILFVALSFRLPAFNYVFGGQDQGVYVNMASSIKNNGSIKAKDPVIDAFVGEYYDIYLKDNYASSYLPGVYRVTGGDGKVDVEFQFYHLFPIWMALTEDVFGAEATVYTLTFFSLMSLLLIYQLVSLVTDRPKYGLIAALLISLNPLHSFFSRWPVTEIPTLMFAIAGFLGAFAYSVSDKQKKFTAHRFLVLSALSFACLFFTRISGFIYIPILTLIYLASLYAGPGEKFSRDMAFWFWGVILLYALSVWYGLEFSSNYSRAIYQISFSKVFDDKWVFGILSLSALFVSMSIFAYFLRNNLLARGWVVFLMKKAEYFIGILFLIAVVVSVYRVYAFAFTDRYASDPWIQGLWKLSGKGMESVAASSLVATIIAITPITFVIFFYFMLRRCESGVGNIIKMAVLVIFSFIGVFNFFVPYQPYYDRYLVSELVPYILILVVVFFAWMDSGVLRSFFGVFLLIGALFAGALSLMHVGKIEQRGAFEDLERIASHIGERDLVLLQGQDLWGKIKTPLVLKFKKNVVSVSDESIENKKYLDYVSARYDNVYLLSSKLVPAKHFISHGVFRVTYDKFNRTRLPAHSVSEKSYPMMLYRMDKSSRSPGIRIYGHELSRFIGPPAIVDAKGVRSNGTAGFLIYGPYHSLPAGTYQLSVIGISNNSQASWVDVVSNKGDIVHGRSDIPSVAATGGSLSSMNIIFPDARTDVEVRVYVGTGDILNIFGYELLKIDETASID